MQNTKDSFYLALRDRLAMLAPERTITLNGGTLNGVTRPAIVVTENETANASAPLPDAFYITWLGIQSAKGYANAQHPLLELHCRIDYWTEGTFELSYQDRGRSLASLDSTLLQICAPATTPLVDHSQSPPITLTTNIFWSRPVLAPPVADGHRLHRVADLNIFFYSEFVC